MKTCRITNCYYRMQHTDYLNTQTTKSQVTVNSEQQLYAHLRNCSGVKKKMHVSNHYSDVKLSEVDHKIYHTLVPILKIVGHLQQEMLQCQALCICTAVDTFHPKELVPVSQIQRKQVKYSPRGKDCDIKLKSPKEGSRGNF